VDPEDAYELRYRQGPGKIDTAKRVGPAAAKPRVATATMTRTVRAIRAPASSAVLQVMRAVAERVATIDDQVAVLVGGVPAAPDLPRTLYP
jgi:hypothetical protein